MEIVSELVHGSPRLAVHRLGRGELCVFLHGIGGNRTNWRRQLPVFAKHFLVCAPDARGYGGSDDYEGPATFADFASDLLRVLEHFHAGKAHLVGVSLGGLIAMEFYARYPERVSSLTLCGINKGQKDLTAEQKQAFLEARRAPLLQGLTPADIAPKTAAMIASPRAAPEARHELTQSIAALHKESYLKTLECAVMHDLRLDPGAIRVPVHVVLPELDAVIPPVSIRALHAAIPNAKLTVIEGAGHLANLEAPEQFDAAALGFLRALPRGGWS